MDYRGTSDGIYDDVTDVPPILNWWPFLSQSNGKGSRDIFFILVEVKAKVR